MHFETHRMYLEIFGEVNIYFGIGIQILSALLLGGAIGYDREVKMKAAGIKTNLMICVGATLYTTISIINMRNGQGMVDPNRVGAQIVSGIGFLGAGAIIQGRGSVIGLTTAATIWVVAAIGFTIGAGYPVVAGIFTFTVIIILKLINPFYKILERESEHKDFQIQVLTIKSVRRLISRVVLNEAHIELDEIYEEDQEDAKDRKIVNIFLKGHPRAIDRIVTELKNMLNVEKCSFREIQNVDEVMNFYSKNAVNDSPENNTDKV